jgi:hypothetical protein
MISSGITDYNKPKTASLVRQRLPEMSASALARAKSDLGVYEKNSSKLLIIFVVDKRRPTMEK